MLELAGRFHKDGLRASRERLPVVLVVMRLTTGVCVLNPGELAVYCEPRLYSDSCCNIPELEPMRMRFAGADNGGGDGQLAGGALVSAPHLRGEAATADIARLRDPLSIRSRIAS